MTVARAAQDEVEAVRREMQEKVKAAQETADRQVRVNFPLSVVQPNLSLWLRHCISAGMHVIRFRSVN